MDKPSTPREQFQRWTTNPLKRSVRVNRRIQKAAPAQQAFVELEKKEEEGELTSKPTPAGK